MEKGEFSLPYRLAAYYSSNPEALEDFFEQQDAISIFGTFFDMLKPEAKAIAIKLATRMILKIAAQISDTGFRTGRLQYLKSRDPSDDIELEQSLERYLNHFDQQLHEQLVTSVRIPERRAFMLMLDRSYSMRGIKIVRAAIAAAAVALHYRKDYGIIYFSTFPLLLKGINSGQTPELLIEKIFNLQLQGETNIAAALQLGLREMHSYTKKIGLLLTDGSWNRGKDPIEVAPRFDALHVICFPPARPEKVEQLALAGHGNFAFVQRDEEIALALQRCLQ
ncbi:MAG TPA: hypothetical protein DCQ14_00265 [Firmicutes bacterium]|nr:hypothetical protein [Bacillota bacterium]